MHDTNKKAGFTLVQIIQTSNIVAHFIDKPGNIYRGVRGSVVLTEEGSRELHHAECWLR